MQAVMEFLKGKRTYIVAITWAKPAFLVKKPKI